jgi:hypothetical protein
VSFGPLGGERWRFNMSGYRIDLRGAGRPGHLKKRAFDALSNTGPCSECRHSYLDDKDKLYEGDEEWMCTRYVGAIEGEPTMCTDQRNWTGMCGREGVGFEPADGTT